MNPIRQDLQRYVSLWNAHPIRGQRNRPNVTPGQPSVLYYDTNVPRYAEPIEEDLFRFCADNLDLDQSNLDAFLPDDTTRICSRIIYDKIGQLLEHALNPKYLFLREYRLLRDELTSYTIEKKVPEISLLPHTREGRDRI